MMQHALHMKHKPLGESRISVLTACFTILETCNCSPSSRMWTASGYCCALIAAMAFCLLCKIGEWLIQDKERSPEHLSMATEQLMLMFSAAVPCSTCSNCLASMLLLWGCQHP